METEQEQLDFFKDIIIEKEQVRQIEKWLSVLPTKRQRHYFKNLFLNKYKKCTSVEIFQNPFAATDRVWEDKQPAPSVRIHESMNWLRTVLDNTVHKVLNQYNYDFEGWAKFIKEPLLINEMARTALADKPSSPQEITKMLDAIFDTTTFKRGVPFYLFNEDRINCLAENLADCFLNIQHVFVELLKKQFADDHQFTEDEMENYFVKLYRVCAQNCEALGFEQKQYRQMQNGDRTNFREMIEEVTRMQNAKNWKKRLKIAQLRINEHIAIACGEVSKKTSLYVSAISLYQYRAKLRAQQDFLKGMIIENEDNPEERLDLFSQWVKSSANPQMRAIELSVQNNGIMASLNPQNFMDVNGHTMRKEDYQAVFFTLTAPSKYHAISSITGEVNSNWNGNSPRQTQQYLNSVWKRVRAQASKYGIKTAGLRVTEPHHDGTPHWHLLLHIATKLANYNGKNAYFSNATGTQSLVWATQEEMDKNHKNATPLKEFEVFIHLFKQQAYKEDGNEPGADKHRFNFKVLERKTYIDKEGNEREVSPAVYMVKYIRKNIPYNNLNADLSDEMVDLDGNQLKDSQTLKETAFNASAWASLWGIRQFQFIGNLQISVWRQVRQLKGEVEQEEVEEIRKVADVGDFGKFLLLKGKDGVFTKRDESLLALHYEEKIIQAGTVRMAVDGIQLMADKLAETGRFIKTRLKKWLIKKKPAEFDAQQEALQTAKREDKKPWVCVSNCNQSLTAKNGKTEEIKRENPEKEMQKTINAIKAMQILQQIAHELPIHTY
ncbi:hypothetical protein A6A19_00780 [Actinobacillus delphinicola]|uniref:replication endonuclease n=1 Tax=Actinobacillus delphinicola TaxID=51161 RepID=UPI00244165FE|nr:replication endonuclease [Actinobacillus delphinicola]MDG6896564.1 hypothetical protein [Actinobacillus delphinicola]